MVHSVTPRRDDAAVPQHRAVSVRQGGEEVIAENCVLRGGGGRIVREYAAVTTAAFVTR